VRDFFKVGTSHCKVVDRTQHPFGTLRVKQAAATAATTAGRSGPLSAGDSAAVGMKTRRLRERLDPAVFDRCGRAGDRTGGARSSSTVLPARSDGAVGRSWSTAFGDIYNGLNVVSCRGPHSL
jgi:hypothetical protein